MRPIFITVEENTIKLLRDDREKMLRWISQCTAVAGLKRYLFIKLCNPSTHTPYLWGWCQ